MNRVDEVILFHRLRRPDMGRIVEIQLGRLEKLLADRKISLDLDADAIDWLAAKGYDPAYGARPLKRVIQKELQDPLAEKILLGDILRRLDGQGHQRLRPAEFPVEAGQAQRRERRRSRVAGAASGRSYGKGG